MITIKKFTEVLSCRLMRLFIQEQSELNEQSRINPVSVTNGIYELK